MMVIRAVAYKRVNAGTRSLTGSTQLSKGLCQPNHTATCPST